MEQVTLESILNNLREQNPLQDQSQPEGTSQYSLRRSNASYMPSFKPPTPVDGPQEIRPVDYNVHPDAIYDRYSDGTHVAKFENYLGEEGNEDRLAQQQSASEQWYNGLTKNSTKMLNYVLDNTVGTAYGIYKGLTEGGMRSVWDNDFSNTMDEWNKSLDYKLPNYYTDEERSMNFLESLGTPNFYANDLASGVAFIGGALIPELILGAATGGATVPAGLAKFGFKSAFKTAAKKGVREGVQSIDNIAKFNATEQALVNLRALNRAKFGEKVGNVLNTSRFLIQTSNFEAGMESRHNFHTALDEYFSSFEDKNGREPSYDEYTKFTKDAVKAANSVYVANMAILSISNAAMLGSKFNIGVQTGKRFNNAGNRLIGLGYKKQGVKTVMKGANKSQRLAGNAYFILGKPAIEGIYEEGLQGVAGTTMQNYLQAKYDPAVESGYGAWAALSDAFAHQYGTKEGWKEMGIGMIIGSMGGTIQGQGITGVGKNSRKSRQKQIEGKVDIINQSQESLTGRLNTATSLTNYSNLMKSKADNFESTDTENAMMNVSYIQAQEQVKPRSEIIADYAAVIDAMELSSEQVEELGGNENVGRYKESLKSEFMQNMEDYKFAKKAVTALGLDRTLKNTPGNLSEVGQAMIMSIVTGKSALQSAKNVASQIDAVIGSEGVFSHMEHFNNLTKEQITKVEELKKKKRQSRDLRKSAEKYLRQIEGMPTGEKRQFSNETKQKRYQNASDKYTAANKRIAELDSEIEIISEGLSSGLKANNFNIDQLSSTEENSHDIEAMVEELDKLDGFIESLRKSNRGNDADALTSMIEEYKMHSDSHREMNNTFRRMSDTNFFSKKEGKGLVNMILGKRYKMSDEFKEIVKQNDKIIDNSLRAVGYRGTEKVEKILQENIEENENLSEREKYRLESIIRLQLGYQKLSNRLSEIQDETKIAETSETITTDPLKGDKVEVKSRVNPEGKDLGNIQVLDKLIKDITDELDTFKNVRVSESRAKELNAQLKELKKRKSNQDEELPIGFRYVAEDEVLPAGDYETRLSVGGKRSITNAPGEGINEGSETDIDAEIETTEKQLEELKQGGKIKIIKSDEFKRMDELSRKKENEGLIESEQAELDELGQELDQWIEITGTVVEGLRLSDLVEQRAVLDETDITPVEKVGEVTSQEVLNQIDIADKSSGVNYDIGQTYQAVTAVRKDGKIEISGIKYEALKDELGFDIEYETNDQNNILIDEETQARINEDSPISILPTNKNLTTTYSVVLKTTLNEDGSSSTSALQTNYTDDFSDQQTPEAIYELSKGDALTLEVDPSDSYNTNDKKGKNKGLLNKYKDAKTDSAKKKALEAIKVGLVIRVKDSEGNFIAVLKAKRKGGNKSKSAQDFEALRDQIVEQEGFVERLLEGNIDQITEFGEVTVDRTYLGHPNFNFSKDGDGVVTIDHRQFTDEDIKKVEDIGFIEEGKPNTHSGKGDIDLFFMTTAIQKQTEARLPFVVISKGGRRIAYPVKVQSIEKGGIEEFQKIYSSNASPLKKANALNRFMASRGLDIKLPGNSFIVSGTSNLNNTFFSKKLAQLESIEYFNSLDTWKNKKADMAGILKDGVSVDINMSDPLHSPKVKLDLSKLGIETSTKDMPQPSNKETVTKGVENLDELRNKKCKD